MPGRPTLSDHWRRRAGGYARPVPFGFPGEVIEALLAHIEAVEAWEAERRKDEGAIRESLTIAVAGHCKALQQLDDSTARGGGFEPPISAL